LELIETSTFTRQIASLLSDEDYANFSCGLLRTQSWVLSSAVVAGYGKFEWLLDHEASGRCSRDLLLGYAKRSDLVALCVFQERDHGFDSKTGFTACQNGQTGVWRMKREMFEELLSSVREAGAILRGRKKPSRRVGIGSAGIRTIRERTHLSQSEFAHLIGVSVKTLQNWEQDRRCPTGPAAALLRIIAHEPRLAVRAIHRT
jgi:putative transcriptional regulator